jgi:hypothetical protein
MDKNKKKVNLIDIIIIVAIVFVIASPFLRAYVNDLAFSDKNAEKITFDVIVNNQSTHLSRASSVGDTVYFENTTDKCGTITAVVPVTYEDQTEYCDFYITITALAKKYNSGIYINNDEFISNGMNISLYTSKYTFFGKVSNLQILQ